MRTFIGEFFGFVFKHLLWRVLIAVVISALMFAFASTFDANDLRGRFFTLIGAVGLGLAIGWASHCGYFLMHKFAQMWKPAMLGYHLCLFFGMIMILVVGMQFFTIIFHGSIRILLMFVGSGILGIFWPSLRRRYYLIDLFAHRTT